MKKASSFLLFLIFILSSISDGQAASGNKVSKKIRISSFVGVEIGGDIRQYEETLSMSRNQTRKMYIDEVVDAAVKLSGGNFNPASMLAPMQKIQEAADNKRDINKSFDSVRIAFSVGEFFKSSMENLHRINGITNAERKIEFVNIFPVINGQVVYNDKTKFDHYIFIQMAHIGSGQFRMSATLGSFSTDATERTYEGSGFLENALYQVAEGIFRSVMQTEATPWNNPNRVLTWIPGPANISSLDAREARLFCSGQEARLPLADELILAHHGTAYRNGGIDRFQIGENYFVADQMRQAGVNYIVMFLNDGRNGNSKIQAVSGQTGRVWCVKGAISERNKLVQDLYSSLRKIEPKGVNVRFFPENISAKNLVSVKAIESLLIHLNAAGAELDVSLKQSDLLSVDEALGELRAVGINIQIPLSILNSL
jgi:hypothetical protein